MKYLYFYQPVNNKIVYPFQMCRVKSINPGIFRFPYINFFSIFLFKFI